MGAGASSSNGLSYAAGGADVSAEASGAGADAYDAVHDPMSEDARAGSAGDCRSACGVLAIAAAAASTPTCVAWRAVGA